jgi:predicted nucleic acid-binding protein
MTDYLIDANCLVSYYTDRSPEQHVIVDDLVSRATSLKFRLCIVPHVLSEVIYVLSRVYDVPSTRVSYMVEQTLATPGIDYLESHPLQRILSLWPERVTEYGDAVLAAVAVETNTPILTFDKAFARQLKRLEIPHEVPS